MHPVDSMEKLGAKDRWKPLKNASSYFEQIPEETPQSFLATHLPSYKPSK